MPPVSQAQRGAMFAAKAGRSTIGIPKDVGAEFAAADPGGTLPKHVGKKKKGKKLALKKKAKRPAPPMRRPAPMADDAGWAGDDGGTGY